MRRVHFILAGIIAVVFCIGYFERPPKLEDFDPVRDAAFKDSWDRRIHLAYWEKWGSFERDACQAMVDAFNRSQDRIYVHYVNTSQVDRKAMLAIIGGTPPDVVGLWAQNVQPFASAGALLPLDSLMAKSGLSPERYTPQYLRIGTYDGRIYALPTTPASVALFYNRDHFKEKASELRAAGLDPERPPRTIEELDRYADVLTEFNPDGSPKRMGFLPTEPGWWNAEWGYYFGGSLYDKRTGRVTPDSSANIRAFLWLKRYAEKYGRDKLLRFRAGFGNFDSPNNAFIAGKVSMEIQGVWFPNFIRRHRPHMHFGVAPFPTARGVPGPRSFLDADVIAIPRGCRQIEAAWEFVRFAQGKGLEILCRLQGKHMPIKDPPPLFREGHPNLELAVFERVAASPYSFILPQLPVWQEYNDELGRAFDHIWDYPVPEKEIEGLSGPALDRKIAQYCRPEIVRTLGEVRKTIQHKLDLKRERDRLRRRRFGAVSRSRTGPPPEVPGTTE
ncbi:MAG: ABC transporter substrate-binding protein [Kiritimatiellaeota bacterium]|nr:ABC transporter substrate-binding protein [Kiritimatiellota bacterium]